jgi:glycosyltransferase involved in cell wall biosynthesis
VKVLYLHQYFATRDGVGGTRSYEFARALVERGHAVTMVCGSSAPSDLAGNAGAGNRRTVDGITVVTLPLPYSNYDSILKRASTFVRFALRSIALALREDYEVLFATSTPLTAGLPGIVMKLFRRKPFVFEVRDLWPELPQAMGVVRNPVVLAALRLLEWLCYRAADGCVGLSPGIVEGIRRRSRPDQPVELIPNGCDLGLFQPERRAAPRIPGVGADDFVALFTGAHGMANGLDAVLDAARVLRERGHTDIKLVFIGDGKLKPALKERARREALHNCVFLDPVPKLLLADIVGAADVGLMILANVPAFYFGTSPNKFFDYLATGLPVLNNYPGWIAELLREHDAGVAVPPEDPVAFAEALVALARDPERCRRLGANARRLGELQFDRALLASRFVQFLETTVRQYGSSRTDNHGAVPS